jgi:hypothetical protein
MIVTLLAISVGSSFAQGPYYPNTSLTVEPDTSNQAASGVSSLVDTSVEIANNAGNSKCSDVARDWNNLIWFNAFENMFPKGHQLVAFVVFSDYGFISAIYPFPPNVDSKMFAAEGTGVWWDSSALPASGQIVPYVSSIDDRMKNWNSKMQSMSKLSQPSCNDTQAAAALNSNSTFEIALSDQTAHVKIPAGEFANYKVWLSRIWLLGSITFTPPLERPSSPNGLAPVKIE